MKKFTKIWVLWLALCSLLIALSTSADTGAVKKLELKLKAKADSCTMSDYNLGEFTVSESAITIAKTWSNTITCELWSNPSHNITLELKTWLSDASSTPVQTIDRSNFSFNFTNPHANWSLETWSSVLKSFTNQSFANQTTLYVKGQKKIWVWSGTLAIWWTIPAWTPSWTYTWELDLLIQ